MAGRVTIQDIADALGVSRNTVSKAINNTGVLADTTREKILQKAVEMGYKQFSYVALAQGGRRTQDVSSQLSLSTVVSPGPDPDAAPVTHGNIALFTSILLGNSHFASTMLDKMQRELSQLGYSISMHRVLRSEIESLKLPNSFVREQSDAIICIEIFDEAYSQMLCDLDIPTLFIDYPAAPSSLSMKSDRLIMDNRAGIFQFISEMVRRGKTTFGFLGDYKHCASFFERHMAFREALIMSGLEINPDFCLTAPESAVEGQPTYLDYLKESLPKMVQTGLPEVLICANDFIAIDALRVFRDLDVSVPKDVLLCGFDDSPEAQIVTPPLTTIHIHSQVMGFSAVHLLISRIKNPTMNYRTITTETTLIYRESTEG